MQCIGVDMTGFESKRQAAQDKMELADAYALAVAATPNMPTPLERKLAVERIERARNALEAALEQQAEPVAREGFEKWAKSLPNYMDISRFEAGYSDCNTDYAWVGWQAAQRKELSASEILNMMPSGIPAEYDGELMEFARAVEAKIKERNHDR